MIKKPNDVSVSRELLPCAYCGRAARYVAEDYVDNSGQPWPFAERDVCNTGAPVEFWNKRAQPATAKVALPERKVGSSTASASDFGVRICLENI